MLFACAVTVLYKPSVFLGILFSVYIFIPSHIIRPKISNIKIEESDFSESSFIEVKIKNLSLYGVNFTKAEFLKSLMDGVDFSSSNITDVMFDIYSVKGIVIDRFQCYELMGMLGVNVK